MTAKTRGPEIVHSFPEGEPIVAMTVFKDVLYVATSRSVYYQHPERGLVPLEIELVAPPPAESVAVEGEKGGF